MPCLAILITIFITLRELIIRDKQTLLRVSIILIALRIVRYLNCDLLLCLALAITRFGVLALRILLNLRENSVFSVALLARTARAFILQCWRLGNVVRHEFVNEN